MIAGMPSPAPVTHATLPPLAVPPIHVTSTAQLWPLVWVAGGTVAGIVAYAIILQPLRRASRQHGWHALAEITSIIGGVVILWGALAGLYLSLDHSRISARTESFIDRAAGALFVLSLAWIAARLAAAWITSFSRRTEHRLFSVSLYSTIVQVVILVLGFLTVLSSLGIAITPVLTTLGLGGLAVALALNDTLSNLFAGLQIVAARQIRVGDYVKFDFAEGEVIDIHWHNTTIRDMQNNVIVIPNSKVNTSPFTNYSMGVSDLVLAVPSLVPWKGSAADLERIAHEAACSAVEEAAGKLQSEKCRVALTAINETNVQVTAYLYVAHVDNRQRALSGYLQRLHDATLRADMGAQPLPASGTPPAAVRQAR